ncbi:MAG: polymer-forming cytoskeletal protein [Deltaproteobacteria bacterium]|nr:polymer-forming cytoskeletal protein [Deltaproteobacteria bacterium]
MPFGLGKKKTSKISHKTKTTSFISESTTLEGTLKVKGGLRIDGRFTGRLESDSLIILGNTAQVNADIKTENLISSGQVVGDVISRNNVQISLPGSVKGAIQTRELIMENGVYFEGSCQIIKSQP